MSLICKSGIKYIFFYKCFMLFFNVLTIFMQWKNVDGVVNKQADSAAPYFVSIDRTQVIKPHLTFTCSKLTTETLEQGVKHVQI